MTTPAPPQPTSTVALRAADHYARTSSLVAAIVRIIRALWGVAASTPDIRTGYVDVLPDIVQTVTAGQFLAASYADNYVSGVLPDSPEFFPAPGSFVDPVMLAGTASDGRDLETLFRAPLVHTVRALVQGYSYDDAVLFGTHSITEIAATQVADAGRVADGIATVTHQAVGYYRMLTPPSCDRCVILAGRFYRWNDGFERHPRCDCKHIPTAEADDSALLDPRRYFDSLSEAEQDRVFGRRNAEAIRLGADISQVVNARRGVTTASVGGRRVKVATAGTTKRGWYSSVQRQLDGRATFTKNLHPNSRYRRNAKPRLMPEAIFDLAKDEGWGRDDVIAELKANGFFLDGDSPGEHPLERIARDVLANRAGRS